MKCRVSPVASPLDPMGEFEPEAEIAPAAIRLRRDERADLGNALLQFLPERNHVAHLDRIRANGVRVEPTAPHAQAPSNIERLARTPLAVVTFDRVPLGRVSPAALRSNRRRSVQMLPMLFIATASVAFVGVFLGLRAGDVGTPADSTSIAVTRPAEVTTQPSLALPFHGSLEVTSSPKGARVLLDDVLVGVTPLLLADLPIGSRAVRVEWEGNKPGSSTVRIVANEPTKAPAAPRPSHVQ